MNYDKGVELGGMRNDEYPEVINQFKKLVELDAVIVAGGLIGMCLGSSPLGNFELTVKSNLGFVINGTSIEGGYKCHEGVFSSLGDVTLAIDVLTPHLNEFRLELKGDLDD